MDLCNAYFYYYLHVMTCGKLLNIHQQGASGILHLILAPIEDAGIVDCSCSSGSFWLFGTKGLSEMTHQPVAKPQDVSILSHKRGTPRSSSPSERDEVLSVQHYPF